MISNRATRPASSVQNELQSRTSDKTQNIDTYATQAKLQWTQHRHGQAGSVCAQFLGLYLGLLGTAGHIIGVSASVGEVILLLQDFCGQNKMHNGLFFFYNS